MFSAKIRACGYAIDKNTGALVALPQERGGESPKKRKITPTRLEYNQGRVTFLNPAGAGRPGYRPKYKQVDTESRFEGKVVKWVALAPGLVNITSQPFTIRGWDEIGPLIYTPDLLLEFQSLASVPPPLRALGFEEATFVESKHSKHVDALVNRKLAMARRFSGLPVVLITEREIATPIADMEVAHVQ